MLLVGYLEKLGNDAGCVSRAAHAQPEAAVVDLATVQGFNAVSYFV